MTKSRRLLLGVLVLWLATGIPLSGQSQGMKAIRADSMKFHLKFLGAVEFRGRSAPSAELDIASRYIALSAERLGLRPLLPGGSYCQNIPVEVTSVSQATSSLRLTTDGAEQRYYFPRAFGVGRLTGDGVAAGSLVLLGLGLSAPQLNWDDLADVNLKGKVAVILDVSLPKEHTLKPEQNRRLLMGRAAAAREKGAVAVVTVINEEREARLAQANLPFDAQDRFRFLDIETGTGPAAPAPASSPAFFQIDVRHDPAAAILGITRAELSEMFAAIRQGRRLRSREWPARRLEVAVHFDSRRSESSNVVAYLEGRDPALSKEYVVISSHSDHLEVRDGRVYPGSDDNASGAVAMLAIAQGLRAERPKRSVIFIWNTAEEKGLLGSYYFVQHCPVPPEKISANLNLDMISRNDPGQIYLIGSNKLSSELDQSIQSMNARKIGLRLDYTFQDPGHPERFFFRSDQYPYIRYGIPGVWFFCGTTEDYHHEGDIEEKADYQKMERVARLVYLVAMDIGNKPSLLKLDVNPKVTKRGKDNMATVWQKTGRQLRSNSRYMTRRGFPLRDRRVRLKRRCMWSRPSSL